jgi:chromosome segregation ATPase
MEARITELEDDKKRLEDDMELCRSVGLELESLHTAAETRIAELEVRLC